MTDTDFTQRFIFTDTDVRGELVCLEESYAHVLAKHDYPEPVSTLLGEFMAAAALLISTVKFDGLLILQARSSGAVPLLMVECSSNREMRAIARYEETQIAAGASLPDMMPDGVLAITIEPKQGQRYQGVVSLAGENIASCLEGYFSSSEQLPSLFILHADGRRARGLLLQQLPAEVIVDEEARQASWQHVTTLAQTLTAEELLGLGNQAILYRLYHEENLELFATQHLTFKCSCSQERSGNALQSLGREDVEKLLDEQDGCIEIDCQFCNQKYKFNAQDVTKIFSQQSVNSQLSTVH
ncbi:MAG: Hsp33 family molecular chaperone HslO [Gammaproteobacteria bacterium]|nr:Hsp33 family molecular chaperone HslO [Gammaproteobacteria bacterium]